MFLYRSCFHFAEIKCKNFLYVSKLYEFISKKFTKLQSIKKFHVHSLLLNNENIYVFNKTFCRTPKICIYQSWKVEKSNQGNREALLTGNHNLQNTKFLLTSSFKIEFKQQVLFIMTLWFFFKIKNNKLKTTLNTIWLINCISFLSRKKEEEVVLVHDSETVKSITYHCKLLQFHMNYRPPYYGTWRKRSQKLSPRNPYKMDTVSLGL